MAIQSNNSTRLEMLATKAKGCNFAVLQYCRDTNQMVFWRWPSDGGVRVEPKDLRKHHDTHYMLGPNCLCPASEISAPDFVEAAIYSISKGPLVGKYVASCAQDKCGYFVFLEYIFNRPVLATRTYERRLPHEQAPPLVTHKSEARPLKRTYTMIDINAPDLVPRRAAPVPASGSRPRISSRKNVTHLLELLDSRVAPGVTGAEFRRLFVKCNCGLFFTRRAFQDHTCVGEQRDLTVTEVIDLTGEETEAT
ncbi:hypothetical protein PILCRDRAFT_13219 [Piloderma croceum F 1598]|uniref:Uncharacterized protein n=1 Tax=Piloderma croceum (strain F 1598) TaxID=765440 RepID=A0A0C3F7K4_PILCF|nr:hypothetical protein PILCRDRAFT_13219 [Piloderma croceum F 1598]